MPKRHENVFMGKLDPIDEKQDENIIHQSQIVPGTIKQRHLEANRYLIQIGGIASRPETPTSLFYYATDEDKLYFYNSGSWKSVSFS